MNEKTRTAVTLALSLLDDIATSECSMGMEDVTDLCEARLALADLLGARYNTTTSRYTPETL